MKNVQQKHHNPLWVNISQKSEMWYEEYRGLGLWKVSEKTPCLSLHLPSATSVRKSRIVTPCYLCFFPSCTTPWAVYLLSPFCQTVYSMSPAGGVFSCTLNHKLCPPLGQCSSLQILKAVCRSLSSLALMLTAALGNAVMLKFNPEPLVPSSAHCPKHLHTSTSTLKCLSVSLVYICFFVFSTFFFHVWITGFCYLLFLPTPAFLTTNNELFRIQK